jgi:photosystem II stability/assembly factor-like uncharacterized protein
LGLSASLSISDSLLYATSYNGVWKTVDKGRSWKNVLNGTWGSIIKTDWQNPLRAWFISNDGKLYRTDNGGKTWQDMGQPIPGGIYSLSVDQDDPSILYTTTSIGIYRSPDRGDTWLWYPQYPSRYISDLLVVNHGQWLATTTPYGIYTSLDAGNSWGGPYMYVGHDSNDLNAVLSSLVADPNDANTLYGVSIKGVYRSYDFGRNWEYLDGSPRIMGDLATCKLDNQTTRLFAGYPGVWSVDIKYVNYKIFLPFVIR